MPHYLSMYDSRYLRSWDLAGKDWTLRIAKVEAQELTAAGGRKSKKPVVYFEGTKKGLALNKTNGKTLAAMYGVDTAVWVGRSATIYPTQTEMGGETVDCIRIRTRIPQQPPAMELPPASVDYDMLERQARAAEAAEGGHHGT